MSEEVGRMGIWAQKAPCQLMSKVSCIEECESGEDEEEEGG